MRGWDDILEFALEAWLTWKKRDEKGGYCDRFPQIADLARMTPIFVYGDSVMSKFTTSPVFTDGFHVFVHENIICSLVSPTDNFVGLMSPITQGLEAANAVALKLGSVEDEQQDAFPGVDVVEHSGFWKALRGTEDGRGWLLKFGLPDLSDKEKMSSLVSFRKSVIESSGKDSKSTVLAVETKRLIESGWEYCAEVWDPSKITSPKGRMLRMSLSIAMGEKMAAARNAMANDEGEMEVLGETWGSALTNWGMVLRSMLSMRDTVNFGRGVLAFVSGCQKSSTLSFEEKTDITNVIAPVLDDMPFKMTWVDMLSGSYEFWPFGKLIRTEIERDVALSEGNVELPEIMAFYSQMPSETPAAELRGDFLNASLTSMFESIDPDVGAEEAAKKAFNDMHGIAKYISQEDALNLVENWRDWTDESCPGIFSETDDESFDGKGEPSEILSTLFKMIEKSRKWSPEAKSELKKLFFE